ncbi:polysaccharide pyruvyl transferase family protein [Kocuria sp. WN036]|uniref:polysaccharide pyruvyl transferase family protein n=1 Tax=Kocuria sp. WN036 TaxID=2032628 RepID=UPI00159570D2|nr:polysaccharide pyruvyl transferase family protein [Kocuria sp. WN036]
MENIALLDTSFRSENDGDRIIVEAIHDQFPAIGGAPSIPTHVPMRWHSRRLAHRSKLLAVTGTNILSRDIFSMRQWPLRPRDISAMEGKVVFCGVGWWQYQDDILEHTADALKSMLLPDVPISARDQYTADKLTGVGIHSVNTGCPTMWGLPLTLPGVGHRDEVVFTLTNYNPAVKQDSLLVDWLLTRYQRVHVWPQSAKDERLLRRSKKRDRVNILDRGLSALESALAGSDYVGTRLHAGIRAAQLGSPMVILAVDNRAIEIARDTGLPVLRRDDPLEVLDSGMVKLSQPQSMKLPHREIEEWKSKFTGALSAHL